MNIHEHLQLVYVSSADKFPMARYVRTDLQCVGCMAITASATYVA